LANLTIQRTAKLVHLLHNQDDHDEVE